MTITKELRRHLGGITKDESMRVILQNPEKYRIFFYSKLHSCSDERKEKPAGSNSSSEHPFYQIECHRHEQRWQEVDGLAVFDSKYSKTGTDYEHTTHDAQFTPHRFWHSVSEEVGNGVEHTLPTKEDRCCK